MHQQELPFPASANPEPLNEFGLLASLVLTDSGGIHEETSYLSIPCLTLRENTERPFPLTLGTKTLFGLDFVKARCLVRDISGQLPLDTWVAVRGSRDRFALFWATLWANFGF